MIKCDRSIFSMRITNLRRISKVYIKILALFLSIIIAVGVFLGLSNSWYSNQNETSFKDQIEHNMSVASKKVISAWESIYTACYSAMETPIFYEHLLPQSLLTIENRLYQRYLSTHLNQMKLQLGPIVDSIFIFLDEDRIIYDNGIAQSNVFFTDIASYETYKKSFWMEALHKKKNSYFLLDDDKYTSIKVNDVHHVIPLVYVTSNQGHRCIFCINLSCNAILQQYYENAVFSKSQFIAFNNNTIIANNSELEVKVDDIRDDSQYSSKYDKYYVNISDLSLLGWKIACFTPKSEFLNLNRFFRFNAIALLLLFLIIGTGIAVIFSKIIYNPIRQVRKRISEFSDSYYWENNEFEYIENKIKNLATDREEYINKSKNFAQRYINQELISLIENNQINEAEYLRQQLNENYLTLGNNYRCINIKFDFSESVVYPTHSKIIANFQSIISQNLAYVKSAIPLIYHNSMVVFIVNEISADQPREISRICKELIDSLNNDDDSYSVRIGIGGIQNDILKIQDSFLQANTALLSLLPDENNQIMEYSETWTGQHNYDRKIISNAILSRDIEKIQAVLEDEIYAIKKEKVEYPVACAIIDDIYDFCEEIMSAMRVEIGVYSARRIEKIDYITILLSYEIDITPILAHIIKTIGSLKVVDSSKKDETAKVIKDYIDQNFCKEVSLDIISDSINVTAKYISRVFKNEYGMNLIDYLQYRRVEKIKELLLTNMSLERIASSVGINNRTTFTRTFRKVTGLSPGEYRKYHNLSSGNNHTTLPEDA